MKKCKSFITIGLLLLLLLVTNVNAFTARYSIAKYPSQSNEVIYHIFQRSFFDSNGDGHGDLNGITQKLDYLQQLGVTSILLTPLYESVFYHNYFATDFYKIDPRYGTMHDYLKLIKELHRRHMKFYMDMEIQYVAGDHIWFRDSYKNPQSKYSDYIVYTDKTNTHPVPIVSGVTELTGYDGITRKLVMVNLDNKQVQDYDYKLFKFWMDPNNDGKFDDGVDGFRLDHMMDNLDNVGRLPHLFSTLWNPLLGKLREVNPKIKFLAEQASWKSFGIDYLNPGGVDGVFAFQLAFAIRDFDKVKIINAADSTFLYTPAGKQQVVFIENHDMSRFSSIVKSDPGKLRIGCVLNLLIGGVPYIYYGQELGMMGALSNSHSTDGEDIPDRQAFEWYSADKGKGMANWYKTWWLHNNDVSNDGVSLQEERNNPKSLWNFYRLMIRLRKNNPVFIGGAYKNLNNNNDQVYSFLRYKGNKRVIVVVNLSGKEQAAAIDEQCSAIKNLYGIVRPHINHNKITASLPAYGIAVWEE